MKFQIPNSKFQIIRKPFEILSSKVFLIWMIGGWIIFYTISAIWMKEAFGFFIIGIDKNPFIQIPFILFLMSGYLNFMRASRDTLKKSIKQFFIWMVLPAGILLFFTGFFISIATRQSAWMITGEGHFVKPGWSSENYRVTKIKPGLKESFLDIDIDTGTGIFQYEPKLTMTDRSSRTVEIGAFPPDKVGDTYYHILKFGLAPGVSLLEGGQVRDESYIVLRILEPGSSDYFEIPPYPYRFLVSMAPERTFQKGELEASQFNPMNPIYKVRVFKGDKVIADGISTEGIFFDNFTLRFFKPKFWTHLEAVKDPGIQVIR
jgi:hypothetical protein